MDVDVNVPYGAQTLGVIVPASAIIEEQEHTSVFVEEKPGTYKKEEVKIAVRNGDQALVTEGLTAGAKVVSQGAQILAAAGEGGAEEKEKK